MTKGSEMDAEDLFYTRFEVLDQRLTAASPKGIKWEFENHGIKYGFNLILHAKGAPETSVMVDASGTVRDLTVNEECVDVDAPDLPESVRNPLTALRLLVAEVWGEV